MHSTNHNTKITRFIIFFWILAILLAIAGGLADGYRKKYSGKIYPNVYIGTIPFSGKTPEEVRDYWLEVNKPLGEARLELQYESHVATISGYALQLGYDATLSATQAYMVGRSAHTLSNMYAELFRPKVNLTPYFRWKEEPITEALDIIDKEVEIPVEEALFQFENGKVTSFRPSKNGKKLNKTDAKKIIDDALIKLAQSDNLVLTISVPIETVTPDITTDKANSFGIKELIGRGYSEFGGSIPGRIHNVVLAASRLNGVLIKPGDTFSFNDTVGDISAATGYQSAYIIKDGRTVLGDGGGVCQVSSTLFRAALAAGLPIVERHAHAYRVHFYEDGGFKPGLDATVYSPTYDLQFTNNTPGYILIQAKPNTKALTLAFEFYGTNDGRTAQILNHKVWGITPPPPALYQDDPTLAKGVSKQVDWAAWGAKTSFDYKVMRGEETLEETTFYSNFRPWQAVFLQGTQ